jgi:hypothetical protein
MPPPALKRLGDAMAGKWNIDGWFRNDPGKKVSGWASYEWGENGQSVVVRWETDTNGENDSGVMNIAYDTDHQACVGRYLDSTPQDPPAFRWEVRDGILTIVSDRYRLKGAFSGDGKTISGRWEQSSDGSSWRYWYDLTYSKVQ